MNKADFIYAKLIYINSCQCTRCVYNGNHGKQRADHRARRYWELEETIMSIQNAIINSPEIEVTSDVQAGSFKLELTSSLRVHAKVPANTFNPGDMIPVARNVNERVGEGRRSHLKFVGYTIEMHKAAGIGKEYFDKESQQFVQNCYFD